MQKKFYFLLKIFVFSLFFSSCSSLKNPATIKNFVLLESSKGDFVIGLYEGTPIFRDNFINNCKTGIYDSSLVYSVVPNRMFKIGIKANETEENVLKKNFSEKKSLKFEKNDKLINKNGAIGMINYFDKKTAVSVCDNRLFYMVDGTKVDGKLLRTTVAVENRPIFDKYIGEYLKKNKYLSDSLLSLSQQKKTAEYNWLYAALMDSVRPAIKADGIELFSINSEKSEKYLKYGGVPEYDAYYTVFGEIVWNLDIIKKILTKQVNIDFKPLSNIYIYKTTVMNKKQYKQFLKNKKKT